MTAVTLAPDDLWVIGGAAVYDAALPFADRAEVTFVDLACDGDVFAPELDAGWQVTCDGQWQTSRTGLRFKCTTYRRAAAIPSTP
jgi:dihydrofolate reductase